MTVYKFENNASTLLDSGIGTGDITLSVTSGEGALFPSPSTGEGFYILVTEGSTTEWMLCTSRSTDTFTVTRSGSPSAFNAGATIKHLLNDIALESFMQKGDFRTNAGSPDGSLSAAYTGEEVLDSDNDIWYKHITGTTWKAMTS